jgi:hypothetical protein
VPKDERLKAKRMLIRALKLWFYISCAMFCLWAFNAISVGGLLMVVSLPIIFLIVCAVVLPDSRQRTRRLDWDEQIGHSFDDTASSSVSLNASFTNHASDDDVSLGSRRRSYYDADSWSSDSHSFLGHNSHSITVFDINSDGSFSPTGTGIMSSGLNDL